ncbi:MAG: tetratricopeptide repeat protein, partial [Planctomycetota bacterium]|nr:tetratricopeptide repeat protein [Planctomycetota bacterium]
RLISSAQLDRLLRAQREELERERARLQVPREDGFSTPQPPSPAASAPEPPVGPQGRPFGRYTLLEETGRGGMGVVYRAWDGQLNRMVALKTINEQRGIDIESVKRFMREARSVAKLDHLGIVKIFDLGVCNDLHYFTMEYLEGKTLENLLNAAIGPEGVAGAPARFSRQQAFECLRDIAFAVAHAHQHGIVHRDLKPANVIVTAKGKPVLTDFGLAKEFRGDESSLTVTGGLMGTPLYMSPEQARGQRDAVGPHSDVYSLGAMMYRLLTGRAPFEAETVLELIKKLDGADPIAPSRIDETIGREAETICLKCLEKDGERRYPTALEFAQDLERLLAGEPISARPVSALSRFWRRAQRNRAALVAGSVAVAIALLAGILFAVGAIRRVGGLACARAAMFDAYAKKDWEKAKEAAVRLLSFSPNDADGMRVRDEAQRSADDRISRLETEKTTIAAAKLEQDERERRRSLAWAQIEAGRKPVDLARSYLYVKGEGIARVRERMAGAIECFQKAREIAPEMAEPCYYIGRAHHLLGDRAQAKNRYKEALTLDGKFAPALVWLGLLEVEEAFQALLDIGQSLDARERKAAAWEKAQEGRARLEQGLSLWRGGKERARGWELEEVDLLVADAMVSLAQGKYEQVLDISNEGSRRHEGEFGREQFAWLRGLVSMLDEGKTETAIREFSDAIEIRPHYAEAYYFRGVTRADIGDTEGAIADYTRAIEIDPVSAVAYAARGMARHTGGDYNGAIDDYSMALKMNPHNAEAHIGRGLTREAKGDVAGAIEDYGEAIKVAPGYVKAHTASALARHAEGDIEGAIADHTEAIRLDPQRAHSYCDRGDARFDAGDCDGAMADYNRALELDPQLAEAYVNRGDARLAAGDYDGAIADFDAGIKLDPSRAGAYFARGNARLAKADYSGAIADYDEATRLKTDLVDAINNRGMARFFQKDYVGAIADASEALKLDPGFFDAYDTRANARHEAGDYAGAVADYAKALELAPADWPGRAEAEKRLEAAKKSMR